MKEALEKLDVSMSNLVRSLSKYGEDYSECKETLSLLAQQYQAFNTLIAKAMEQDGENYPYFVKYSNMENIKKILEDNGLLEQSSKGKER